MWFEGSRTLRKVFIANELFKDRDKGNDALNDIQQEGEEKRREDQGY